MVGVCFVSRTKRVKSGVGSVMRHQARTKTKNRLLSVLLDVVCSDGREASCGQVSQSGWRGGDIELRACVSALSEPSGRKIVVCNLYFYFFLLILQ